MAKKFCENGHRSYTQTSLNYIFGCIVGSLDLENDKQGNKVQRVKIFTMTLSMEQQIFT